MSVEKGLDELWVAVKFQSNTEIAGSPRNSFRASVWVETTGGRALERQGGVNPTDPYQTANAGRLSQAVRRREISCVVKRERARIGR